MSNTKLTLEHLSAYLPYQLKMVGCQSALSARILEKWENDEWDITPILRPLSDLTTPINHQGKTIIPTIEIGIHHGRNDIKDFPREFFCQNGVISHRLKGLFNKEILDYRQTCKLIEWHFDLFDLIENELAVSVHDVL